jgi:hypothetical protein
MGRREFGLSQMPEMRDKEFFATEDTERGHRGYGDEGFKPRKFEPRIARMNTDKTVCLPIRVYP